MKIHYHEIVLTLVPKRPWMMPPSPGTMVRGAFGEKFRRLHCKMDDQQSCKSCPHQAECIIPQWFDPGVLGSGSIRGWALHALPWPAKNNTFVIDQYTPLHVRILLLEPLRAHNDIVKSLRIMLQQGLGPERIPHYAQKIEINGVTFNDWTFAKWPKARTHTQPNLPDGILSVRMQLRTPFVPSKSSAQDNIEHPYLWWKAALHRMKLIREYRGQTWNQTYPPPNSVKMNAQLHPVTIARYSRRQGAHLKFQGYEGTLFLKGPAKQLAPFFWAEPFQIGRATTLGCGAYTLLY